MRCFLFYLLTYNSLYCFPLKPCFVKLIIPYYRCLFNSAHYTQKSLCLFKSAEGFCSNIQCRFYVMPPKHAMLCGIGVQIFLRIRFRERKFSEFERLCVTGQTFLSSKGQIFLSSSHPIFPRFDPPSFFLFFSNFLSVSLIIWSTFMRLAECNLEIKRLLFSPFISGYFSFKGN